MEKLLKVKQVAEYLQITEEAVRRYVRSGILPSVKLGNRYFRIKQSDLEKSMKIGFTLGGITASEVLKKK